MLVRKFICERWDTTGELGWKPLWMGGLLDPSGALGVAHDVLEHVAAKMSDADGELQALGAIVYNRLEGGAAWMISPGANTDGVFTVSGIVYEILNNVDQYEQRISDPGRWHKLGDEWDGIDKWISGGVSKGVTDWLKEFKERFDDTDDACYALDTMFGEITPDELIRRVAGWVTKGFRNTKRYYEKHLMDATGVAYMYKTLYDLVNDIYLEDYMEGVAILSVHVNVRQAEVKCKVTMPRDYYDEE
jgi:hypothetical protein